MRTLIASCFSLNILVASSLAQPPLIALPPAQSSPLAAPDLAQRLRSREHSDRLQAIKDVAELREIPGRLVGPIVSFIKLELTDVIAPDGRRENDPADKAPITEVHLTGEEVSLVRIKANPDDYIDKTFILCGALKVSSYYNYGYRDAVTDYFSFRFRPADAKVRLGSDSASLFLARAIGRRLADDATRAEEDGFDGLLVRLKCTARAERIRGDKDDILSMIEITDWQGPTRDGKGWKPWNFDGVEAGFVALGRAGLPAIPALIDMLCSDQVYQTDWVDAFLRYLSLLTLTSMDLEARKGAYSQAKTIASKSKSATARQWANTLLTKALTGDELTAIRRAPKPIDQAARAATTLRSAQNLEKAKRIPGALTIYRQIIKDFPGTSQAETAADRIKTLESAAAPKP
jgi:hypothetical protein